MKIGDRMENKGNKENGINMILVIIIVILLGIVGYCAYRLGDTGRSVVDDENLQKGGNTSVEIEKVEDNEETDTTYKELTSEEIKKIYDDIDVLNEQLTEEYGYFEKINGKITSNQMSDKAKLIIAYKKLLKDNSQKIGGETSFTKKQISDTIKKIFGNDVTYRDSEFVIYNQTVTFDNDKYFEKKGEGTSLPGFIPTSRKGTNGLINAGIIKKRISEKQEKGKLIIEEKYIEMVEINRENSDGNANSLKQTFGIYKEVGDFDKEKDSYLGTYICTINDCPMESFPDKYLDKINTLRYIFTSDSDGNYYLESVEVIRI